ncbi:hypothetical protein LPJ63_001429 [Coemansia sp. RSA 2711]|nr:hypothetical protein LPJ63_001429 [Coemansia sp. RSA 2711]
MFKKPYQTKAQSALRVSACRHLVQETKDTYPQTADQTPGPMPGKLQSAKFVSHVGDKGEIIYSESNEPLWFRAEVPGATSSLLVPTVYTLWQFPALLPVLWTWAPVVEKLIGGADLMVPGLVVPEHGLPDLKRGQLVAICCPGSLAAQAVGVLTVDTREIQRVAGAKGKAVLVAHTYRDHLWEAGSKAELPEIPLGAGSAEAAVPAEPADETPALEALRLEEDSSGPQSQPAPAVTAAEMDALLLTTLKQVMATVLDQRHATPLLPLGASTLYSTYMLANAPARGAELDIKKSSYKKLAKFLKAAEKQGLLGLKDIRGEPHVKSLNWQHAELSGYQPYAVKLAAPAAKPASVPQSGPAPAARISVTELLKPPQALRPLFDLVCGEPATGYFTRQQARGVLESYIKQQALVDPQAPRNVRLDHHLCDGLLTKAEYSKLSVYPRDQLQARLQEKMTLYTRLDIPGRAPTTRIGRPPTVDVVCEKKMGNKVVTRALGLEAYGVDPAAVAKELRVACASSTSVDPVPGKKTVAVLVQGHQVKALARLLEKQHGLPADLIKVTDKSGKAKK